MVGGQRCSFRKAALARSWSGTAALARGVTCSTGLSSCEARYAGARASPPEVVEIGGGGCFVAGKPSRTSRETRVDSR
jgi:hypothetical protein